MIDIIATNLSINTYNEDLEKEQGQKGKERARGSNLGRE